MGILSRRAPRPSFLPRCVLFFAFLSLALLLIFEVDNLVSQTKTIVGHNLEPTPWHVFPAKPLDEESAVSKASTIIQCSYLSCPGRVTIQQNKSTVSESKSATESVTCPDLFRHIYNDLEPWSKSRISMDHVTEAQQFASFRVVIIGGKLFVDYYYACVQSRAMFTIWGILQLLRRYPGKVPDVDLMFDCMDKPIINRTEHASMPLPLFRYCTTSEHFDIPFPDWSFWGWSEVNIGPWEEEFKSIKEGSKARSWFRKLPVAFWKGNPDVVSPIRIELMQCNDTNLWRAQILRQDWEQEVKSGFQKSKLSKQCNHRYKIYAEGYAWSVSLKYILACGCLPLIISPQYQDFFSRGLVPQKNFWPIPQFDLCPSIKAAVEWGNAHSSEAEAIGKAAQDYIGSLSIDRIYDYMFHLISEYAKLQDFVPVQPPTALEMCTDSVLCFADDKQRKLLKKSLAFPSQGSPCTIPK